MNRTFLNFYFLDGWQFSDGPSGIFICNSDVKLNEGRAMKPIGFISLASMSKERYLKMFPSINGFNYDKQTN